MVKTSGVIIENEEGDYLFQLRGPDAPSYKNLWSLFGGHSEKDETPLDTARRELKEELNIDFAPERFSPVGEIGFLGEDGSETTAFLYELSIKPEEKIKLGEGIDFGFFTKEEARELPMPDFMKNVVAEYF